MFEKIKKFLTAMDYFFLGIIFLIAMSIILFGILAHAKVAEYSGGKYYYPDSGVTNQSGVTGLSVYNMLTGINTNPNVPVTMKFAHNSGTSTIYKFESAITVPANVTILVENGAYLSGPVTFSGSQDISLDWFEGAKSGGTVDCSAALRSAVTACVSGGTIKIPSGKWAIKTPVAWQKIVNLQGEGKTSSVLWIETGSGTTALHVKGSVSFLNSGLVWKNFSILSSGTSAAPACQRALAIEWPYVSRFEDIAVWTAIGDTDLDSMIWFTNPHECHVSFDLNPNSSWPYYSSLGYRFRNGITIAELDGTATISNANVYDMHIAGLGESGWGIKQICNGNNGNSLFTGTIQGCMGKALYLSGGFLTKVVDMHIEEIASPSVGVGNTVYLEDISYLTVDNIFVAATGTGNENVFVDNCDYGIISNSYMTGVSIFATSSCFTLDNIKATRLYNSSETLNISNLNRDVLTVNRAAYTGYGSQSDSLIVNGGFERWNTDSTPVGWSSLILACTYTKESGVTYVKQGKYSAKISGVTSGLDADINISENRILNLADYSMVSISGWIYIPTAGGQDIQIKMYWDSGADVYSGKIITTRDAWVPITLSLSPRGRLNDMSYVDILFQSTNGPFTFYLDGFSAVASTGSAPVGYVAEDIQFYSGTTSLDLGSIGDGNEEAFSVTVAGAELGMICSVTVDIDIEDLQATATVTGTDTVTVVVSNPTGGSIDINTADWYVVAQDYF